MPRSGSDSLRYGDEQRGRQEEPGTDLQFLDDLAADGLGRIFVRLDVPTARQPEPGKDMIDQQQPAVCRIDDDEIRNQVLRRGRGFCQAEKGGARRNPAERVGSVLSLDVVPWHY